MSCAYQSTVYSEYLYARIQKLPKKKQFDSSHKWDIFDSCVHLEFSKTLFQQKQFYSIKQYKQ